MNEITKFDIQIISPEKVALEQSGIDFLKVPGTSGEVGILANHTPALISLEAGEILIKSNKKETWYFIPKGQIEILPDKCLILTPYLEPAPDIDLTRAESSMERAIKRLENPSESIDLTRAKTALKRAQERVKLHARLNQE